MRTLLSKTNFYSVSFVCLRIIWLYSSYPNLEHGSISAGNRNTWEVFSITAFG